MNGKDMVAVMMAVNKLDDKSFTAKDEEVATNPTWNKRCSDGPAAALQLKNTLMCLQPFSFSSRP